MPNNPRSIAQLAARLLGVLPLCLIGAMCVAIAAEPAVQKDASEPTDSQNSTSAQPHCVDVNGDVQVKNSRTSGSAAAEKAAPQSTVGVIGNSQSNPRSEQSGTAAQQRQASNGPPC